MTALSLPYHAFFTGRSRKAEPRTDDTARAEDADRRRVIGDMISAGACDSEYGAQMLMAAFPRQY